MKTKIVYCIVSNEKDIYLEQAWASIYTLRRYNADAHVILLVDKGTEATLIGKRAGIRELVDDVVAVDTPEGYSAMQRSRYLKTNFRQFLSGDLLFIDSDTLIGGPLAEIDSIDADIACVPDSHRSCRELTDYDSVNQRLKDVFGISLEGADFYFNSGVIYVRDNDKTHGFFADWYENWKHSALQKNVSLDQPALFATDKKHGFMIKEMSGVYNCQIAYCLKYLLDCVVLHFFNIDFRLVTDKLSPFYGKDIYNCIKEHGGVEDRAKQILDDKNEWLNIQTNIIDSDHAGFLCLPFSVRVYESFMKGTRLYRLIKLYCSFRTFCGRFLKIIR